jgi:hypothetical protein
VANAADVHGVGVHFSFKFPPDKTGSDLLCQKHGDESESESMFCALQRIKTGITTKQKPPVSEKEEEFSYCWNNRKEKSGDTHR